MPTTIVGMLSLTETRSWLPGVILRRFQCGITCLAILVLGGSLGLYAQNPFPRPDDSTDNTTSLATLPSPPRELRRDLKKAEDGLKQLEFAESIETLNRILQDAQQGDYFLIAARPEDPLKSLRGEVERLLGDMPQSGREMYELQVGASARKQLEDALIAGDVEGLGDVCRRYFHTREGYRSCYLLARYHLDRRQPTSAIMYLQRLRNTAEGKKKEPEISILTALAWWMAGRGETARATLADAAKQFPQGEIVVSNQARRLPSGTAPAAELDAWLAALALPAGSSNQAPADWLTADGDATRDRRSLGGMPLPRLEWWNPLPFQSDSAVIADASAAFSTSDIPAIPLPRPLILGDWVVMPTPRMLLGIRLEGGARRWYYPSNAFQGDSHLPQVGPYRDGSGLQMDQLLRQRIWEDGVASQMSTDGRNIYCLRDVPPMREGQTFEPAFGGGFGDETNVPRILNRLIAIDVLGEGRTRWSIGKGEASEPQLEEAFFLGAPIPIGDALYAIVEIKDELRLVVLDAANGKVRWSQQLLQLEIPLSVGFSTVRRMAACAPSYRDGILVCPTAAGNVIALNPANRSLLWGFQYPTRDSLPMNANPMMSYIEGTPQIGNRWIDGNPLLTESAVVLTPIETDKLFCLDLLTGKPRWPELDRGDGLYVAGVSRNVGEGIIVVVGQRSVRGIRVSDGEEAWPPITIPDGNMPCGRGFMNGSFVYFATTGSEILRIDASRGTITERMKTDGQLGNLSCARNYLISQSAGEIRAYLLRESLRRELTEQVATSNDPSILQDYANLLLGDGEALQATEILRKAIQLSTDDATRERSQSMLLQTILTLLLDDFAKHQGLVFEARALAKNPADRRRLLQIISEFRGRSGNVLEAMDALMELASLPTDNANMEPGNELPGALIRMDGTRRGSPDVWLRTQFSELLRTVPEEDRSQLFARIDQLKDQAFAGQGADPVLRFLDRFGDFPQGSEARLEAARRLSQQGSSLLAELYLSQVRNQGTDAEQQEANRLLANLLMKNEPVTVRKLTNNLSSPAVEGSPKSAESELLSPAQQEELNTRLVARTRFPNGAVQVNPLPLRTGEIMREVSLEQIEAGDDHRSAHEGVFLTFDRESSSFFVGDSMGRVRQQLTIPLPNAWRHGIRVRRIEARVCGSLLVFSAGPTAFAVDMSGTPLSGNDSVLWRHAIDETGENENDLGNFLGVPGQQENRNPFLRGFDNMQAFSARGPIRVGPVSPNGVCLLARGSLTCLDPLLGTVRWQRQRIGEAKHIFGDAEHVFLVPRNATQATAYRIADGTELGTRKVPLAEQHWTHRGSKILAWESTRFLGIGAGKPTLFLYDTLSEKRTWELNCESGTRGCLVDQDELAILRPNGQLEVFDLLLGPNEPRLKAKLDLASQPLSLQVIRGQNDYLVFANVENAAREGQLSRREIQVTGIHLGMGTSRMTGQIASFERGSQRPRWSHPLDVKSYFLGSLLPPDSPVIVLYRQIQATHVRGPNDEDPEPDRSPPPDLICEVVLIDRRDGSLLHQTTDVMPQAYACPIRIVAEPEQMFCDVLGTNQFGLRLNFTEEPTPPRQVAELPTVEQRLADYRGHDLLENTPASRTKTTEGSPSPAPPPPPVVEPALPDDEEIVEGIMEENVDEIEEELDPADRLDEAPPGTADENDEDGDAP